MAVGRIVLSQYMPARDRNGQLVSGARLFVYQNRTTTKAAIFADSDLSSPLANPVIANSSGQFPNIWATRGTVDVAILYTLSVTGPDGESIGNPSVFDDFMPSSNEVAADAAVEAVEARDEAVEAAEDIAATALVVSQQAAAAEAARIAAEAAADEAAAVSVTGDAIYPTATAYVPYGAQEGALPILSAGSGYTNGTYALAFTGGNFDTNPSGTFTVSGTGVTAITITGPGRKIGASPALPTLSFAAGGAGTGAAADLLLVPLVGSGHNYWANHASDTSLYQLYENDEGSPAAISGATLVKNLTGVNQRYQRVRLQYVSGSVSSNYTLRVAQSNVILTGDATQYIFEWQAPFACDGNHNVAITQNNGSAFLPLTQVQNGAGATPALNSFAKYDWMEAVRNPSPIGDNPGSASTLRALIRPNTAVTQVSKGVQRVVVQRPSESFPVSVQPLDAKNQLIRTRSVIGPADRVMDDDHVVWVMKDLADSMSLTAVTCASALALNSDWMIHNGREYRYSQFLSDELPGGSWSREQPSTTEPVDRVGLYGDAVSAFHLKGLNHAGYMANTVADATAEMDGDEVDLEIMDIANGEELIYSQRFDDYRTTTLVNGESRFIHTFNDEGCTLYRSVAVGRQLSFDAGVIEISPGAMIEGGTSGALSEVVSLPSSQQTGAWGSTRAGKLFVKHVSGTWQDNESIIDQSTGNTYATVNGTLGAQVGVQNAYGVLSCNTTVNRVWAGFMDGLTLYYDSGTVAFGVGNVVVGEDSGVSAVVATVPTTGQTGSTGAGTLAGYLTFTSTTPNGDTSVWWPGERLLVGGVPKARVKDGVTVGAADGSQITVVPAGYPVADMFRAYHTNNDAFRQLYIPSGAPMTPPGDFSYCTTSICFIEDRVGGNRKIILNWCSADGAISVLYEGTFESEYTINYGVAWPGAVS